MSFASGPGRVLFACATVACAMSSVAMPVRAATVRVGPKLNGTPVSSHVVCENKSGCTAAQQTPSYTSPVTGMIVDWRLKGAVGTFTLRVLDGNTGGTAFPIGTAPTGSGETSTFPAEIPIVAGERFGVDFPDISGTELGYTTNSAATFSYWGPTLAQGETRAPKKEESNAELLLNVDIQPAPGITAVAPASGPILLPDAVTISGHDFEEVRSVEVGGQFAAFEVLSETTIVAEAVGFTPGTVPVTVTTRAGSATLPAAFSFEPRSSVTLPATPPVPGVPPVDIPPQLDLPENPECHVPKLKGKTLRAAKRELTASHCQLGTVTKRKGVIAAKGKVVGQLPPPGSHAAARAHVQVRLG